MISKKEIMEQVYDTLMENVGMSPHHVKFPVENVSNQFVNNGVMYFEFQGKAYEISIKEVKIIPDE